MPKTKRKKEPIKIRILPRTIDPKGGRIPQDFRTIKRVRFSPFRSPHKVIVSAKGETIINPTRQDVKDAKRSNVSAGVVQMLPSITWNELERVIGPAPLTNMNDYKAYSQIPKKVRMFGHVIPEKVTAGLAVHHIHITPNRSNHHNPEVKFVLGPEKEMLGNKWTTAYALKADPKTGLYVAPENYIYLKGTQTDILDAIKKSPEFKLKAKDLMSKK